MPLYEYRCKQCSQVFEKIQKFSDEPLTVHDGCGGEVERLISAPGLHFKGSGWYITDYARSGSNGKSSASSSESSSEKKSDTKTKTDSSSSSSSTSSSSTPATTTAKKD